MNRCLIFLFVACAVASAHEYVPLHPGWTPAIEARARMDNVAPILPEHPSTNDVPSGGMFYRLAETNGVETMWYVRTPDLISTQLSAHDANGDEIVRTVNLRTGIDRTINLRALTRAKKFQDLEAAETVRTNSPTRK